MGELGSTDCPKLVVGGLEDEAGEQPGEDVPGAHEQNVCAELRLGLYPIVTLQYNSTTLYQVSYQIR
jgi:hypothetical protein